MRKLLILTLLVAHTALAQTLQLPELSPRVKVTEDIGYTHFEIQYGRPSLRQRKIFGDLIPYQKIWRTGAGKSTRIIFSTDVFINDKKIPAGAYALVTIPGEKEWTVMLNSDTSKVYGVPREYNVANEAVRTVVKVEETNHIFESLTIFLDSKNNDAELYLAWENTQIHFPIITKSSEKAMAIIESALQKNPDDVEILNAAVFYHSMNNGDPNQLMRWLDHALSVHEDRWTYNQKIELYEKMKNYSEARKTATKAIAYMKKDKPEEWEENVSELEKKMKTWPN